MLRILKHRKKITPRMKLILIVTLVWFIADKMLEFAFPVYLESVNKSFFEIGLLLSIVSVSGLFINLPLGSLSDRASRKKMMISGLALSVATAVIIFSFSQSIILGMALLLWGMFYQLWKVPRDAYFASLTDRKNRGFEYGLDAEIMFLGNTLGPIIGGVILAHFGFPEMLGSYALLLLIAASVVLIFLKETNYRPVRKEIRNSVRMSSFSAELKEFKILGAMGTALLFVSMLLTFWEGIILAFIPLFYGPDILNITADKGGLLLAFFFLPGIFLSYHAGKITDRFGKKKTLFAGLAVMGTASLMFSSTSEAIPSFALALIMASGWGFSVISMNALFIDLFYKHRKGKAIGIMNLFMDIGFIAGPLFGGVIAELFGLRSIFVFTGLMFIFSSAAVLLLKNKLN